MTEDPRTATPPRPAGRAGQADNRLPAWLVLSLFFASVVGLGAVLAPPLFHLGKGYASWAVESGHADTPLLGALASEAARADFARYFNRGILVAALVLIWPFARLLKLRRSDFPTLLPRRSGLAAIVRGLAVAGLPFLALATVLAISPWFRANPDASWTSLILAPLVAAAAVAILEEWLFRGAFTSLVARSFSPGATLWFIAVLFAILHFLQPPEGLRVPDGAVGGATGFVFAGVILGRLLDPADFLAGFATLLAVGLLLGWARHRTGSIWLGVGLHAAWVFILKAFSAATRRETGAGETLPWLGGDLRTGLLPLAVLALTGLVLAVTLRRRDHG